MVNILVWNVNAWAPTVKNVLLKHGSIRKFFDDHKADVVCLQETKLMEEKLTEDLACVEGFESFWAFSQKKMGYSGVATFVRDDWSPVAAEIDCLGSFDADLNGEGRIIVTDHGSFVLLNVYVPNAGKKGESITERADLKIRFLHALKEKCDAFRENDRKVILVGDLNVAASTKDCHPSIGWSRMYHKEELAIMHSILWQYTDMWRKQNPHTTDVYTVWDEKTFARSVNKGLRIDYVLVSPSVLPDVGPCRILDMPHKWSDHAALHVAISGLDPPPNHEPVPASSKRMKQFDKRQQRSIAAMFASRVSSLKKNTTAGKSLASAPQEEALGVAAIPCPAAPSGDCSSSSIPVAKRRKIDTSEDLGGTLVDIPEGLAKGNEASFSVDAQSSLPLRTIGSGDAALDKSRSDSESQTNKNQTESRIVAKKASEVKRDKGQAGIKSFFAKTNSKTGQGPL